MSEIRKSSRLSKAAQEFNVGMATIVEFLHKKGIKIDNNANTKLTPEAYDLLVKEYQSEKTVKETSQKIELEYTQHKTISIPEKRHVTDDDYEPALTRDELIIRNMPPEPETGSKPAKKEKAATPKKKADPTPEEVAETTVQQQAAPAQPVEQETEKADTPVAVEEPVKEAPVKHIEPEIADEPAKPAEPVSVAETPAEEPKAEQAEPAPGKLKVVGKIDLDSVVKTPSKKEKATKKKARASEKTAVEEKVETPAAATPVAEEQLTKPAETAGKEKDTDTVVETPEAAKAEEVKAPETTESAGATAEAATETTPAEPERASNFIRTKVKKLEGPTILGTMKLPEPRKPEPKVPVASSSDDVKSKKKKRKRIKKAGETGAAGQATAETTQTGRQTTATGKGKPARDKKGTRREAPKPELSPEDIQKQIKETLQRLSGGGKSKASKYRREKRSIASQMMAEEAMKREEDQKNITVAEFVTVNELASLMDVPVNQVISTCLSLGLFVSINQRLDAETIVVVADEFGFTVKFVGAEDAEVLAEQEEEDNPEDLVPRAPIVTVMGHVDHGKTSLLDYIRNANVIAGEAGGITQHIGAYEVKLPSGKKITFLDTPGHEAFTAMRARGAKITDIVIIVIAADDMVMPQTVEAINHAQAAGVPIVFAINKIDKPAANPEKIKEELSKRNILVEDWGGKYQSQEISAKKGINVDLLLEKVLLEAELLELKANPKKLAHGTILESSLDKGRGYVAKILVQAGTLKQGDLVMAGITYGRVKAMYNERNQLIKEAGPSAPLLMLGLNAAPVAGDTFRVMTDEREAKSIVSKRQQLQREQGIRTQKHITLDEIGRRIAIGDFKELNIIVKGDVDGSVEALSDSLLKLTTPEVQVNIIHKSVGAITESDVLLASASNAVIVGFQVRPSLNARKLAEQEEIDIRIYSIIYTAINEIKQAIEGMLSPEIEEKIICNLEVRDVFKITKVGTVAGCMVLDGKINRNTRVRVIRDGIVVYTGHLGSLKRFKDDVKEVAAGYECGLNIENFNDIKVRDIIEGYEEVEIKRKL